MTLNLLSIVIGEPFVIDLGIWSAGYIIIHNCKSNKLKK